MAVKVFWSRIRQTARLMVGIGDYARYCAHMRQQHPEAVLLSETEYFRYCQQARYPANYCSGNDSTSKKSVIKSCPC